MTDADQIPADVAGLADELRDRADGLDRLLSCASIPARAMRRAADELARVARERDGLQGQIVTQGICFDRVAKQRDDFRAQVDGLFDAGEKLCQKIDAANARIARLEAALRDIIDAAENDVVRNANVADARAALETKS